MKDVQGIQRGKCNSPGCECEEYRTNSDASGKCRCEYCDHSPVQHVKIIELGECKSCGKDNCEKYEFENPNSYGNCAYCDCPANAHAGAEKLRKPQPQRMAVQTMTASQPMTTAAGYGGGFQPRMDPSGHPTQSVQFGKCKIPDCPYPRRVEGGKVHDFCSKTCANKYSQVSLQGPGGSQFMSQSMSGCGGSYGGGYGGGQIISQPPRSSSNVMMSSGGRGGGGDHGSGSKPVVTATAVRSVHMVSKSPVSSGSGLIMGMGQGAGTGSLCTKCGIHQANQGHKRCQSCYTPNT